MIEHLISVTDRDIAESTPRAARGCAVYLACYRVLGSAALGVRADGTIVVRTRSSRFGEDAVLSVEDAGAVRFAVEAIDCGLGDCLEPFEFVMGVPE